MQRLLAVLVLQISLTAASYPQQHEDMHQADDSVDSRPSMPGAILFRVPMSTEGSGTSWQPETSPMHMAMFRLDQWNVLLHGSAFPRYTRQGGLRGESDFSSPNWIMASAQRMVSENSQIMFRTMLSVDRITEGGDGYPLLLQSGETWQGKPLIDRQHPHDLFAEISGDFSFGLSEDMSGYVYIGYPGEPALGPPAFMHRSSAMYGPDAPVSHHWQDATHISFGVATLGWVMSNVKVEGSIFTGREPDENRFNFDKPTFDSYSWRVSVNPAKELALQVSTSRVRNPEGNGNDVIRTTASVLHSMLISGDIDWSTSFVWGQNDEHHGVQNSYLLESAISLTEFGFYTRLERIEKPHEELGVFVDPERKENVSQFSVGALRTLGSSNGLTMNFGAQGSVSILPNALKQFYGNNPFSFQVFLQLLPGRHGDPQAEHDHH